MRVELGEIEAALSDIDDIETCAVVVHTNLSKRKNLIAKDRDSRKHVESDSQQVLVAYFIAASELSGSELRQRLTDCLPVHMIPQQFIRCSRVTSSSLPARRMR